MSTLIIGATFSAFSFLTPLLTELTGLSESIVPVLLLIYGVATVVGNVVVGRLADRHTITTLLVGTVQAGVTMNPVMIIPVQRLGGVTPLIHTVHASFVTLGVMIGSAIGASLIPVYGLRALIVLGIVLAILAILPALASPYLCHGMQASNVHPKSSSCLGVHSRKLQLMSSPDGVFVELVAGGGGPRVSDCDPRDWDRSTSQRRGPEALGDNNDGSLSVSPMKARMKNLIILVIFASLLTGCKTTDCAETDCTTTPARTVKLEPMHDDHLDKVLTAAYEKGLTIPFEDLSPGDWAEVAMIPEGTGVARIRDEFGVDANWGSDFFVQSSYLFIFYKNALPVKASMVVFNSIWRDHHFVRYPRTAKGVFQKPLDWMRVER